MSESQRWLIIAFLCLLATASAAYCLDYRMYDFYRIGGLTSAIDGLSPPGTRFPPDAVISFGETKRLDEPPKNGTYMAPSLDAFIAQHRNDDLKRRVTGLYPHPGMSVTTAAIGGLLVPVLLAVAAGYFALGSSRINRRSRAIRRKY